MQVKQLIELLKTQDQEAIVDIVVGEQARAYGGDHYNVCEFDPSEHMQYTDFRANKFVKKTDSYYGKSFLLLGSAE